MGLMHNINKMMSSEKFDWESPDWVFNELDALYGFAQDVCADEHNTKCEDYIDTSQNGLKTPWKSPYWMNPPYGKALSYWIDAAIRNLEKGSIGAILIPSRTDTKFQPNGHQI